MGFSFRPFKPFRPFTFAGAQGAIPVSPCVDFVIANGVWNGDGVWVSGCTWSNTGSPCNNFVIVDGVWNGDGIWNNTCSWINGD